MTPLQPWNYFLTIWLRAVGTSRQRYALEFFRLRGREDAQSRILLPNRLEHKIRVEWVLGHCKNPRHKASNGDDVHLLDYIDQVPLLFDSVLVKVKITPNTFSFGLISSLNGKPVIHCWYCRTNRVHRLRKTKREKKKTNQIDRLQDTPPLNIEQCVKSRLFASWTLISISQLNEELPVPVDHVAVRCRTPSDVTFSEPSGRDALLRLQFNTAIPLIREQLCNRGGMWQVG